jgi:uncharacterized Zn finger protein
MLTQMTSLPTITQDRTKSANSREEMTVFASSLETLKIHRVGVRYKRYCQSILNTMASSKTPVIFQGGASLTSNQR